MSFANLLLNALDETSLALIEASLEHVQLPARQVLVEAGTSQAEEANHGTGR